MVIMFTAKVVYIEILCLDCNFTSHRMAKDLEFLYIMYIF